MREIQIIIEKETFAPGETIEGHVYVVCDEEFGMNAVNLTLSGKEHTRVVTGSGDNRRVYTASKMHIDETVMLSGPGQIREGDTRFDFVLILPDYIPASYDGVCGWIEYEIEVKVEVSWALDPKAQRPIYVIQKTETISPNRRVGFLDHEGSTLLHIEVERDVVEIGRDYLVKLRWSPIRDIRGVRVELIHREFVSPRGHKQTTKNVYLKQEIEAENIPVEMWFDILLQPHIQLPLPFQTELIRCWYILKITVDIPWRTDKVLKIPVHVNIYNPAQEPEPDPYAFDF
ncbi:MAG: sporulation protein [Candidatus Thorarchaeota archaeon]